MDPSSFRGQGDAFIPLQPFPASLNAQQAHFGQQPQWQAVFAPPDEQKQLRKYTAKDWVTNQPELTRLYENGTLDDVNKSMRERYGLDAT
jgi:hypothetical protein